MKNKKIASYKLSVLNLTQGSPQEALEQTADMRSQEQITAEELLLQKLISYRIAIKNGQFTFDIETLEASPYLDSWIQGEVHFVKGTYYFLNQNPQSAFEAYDLAFQCFKNTDDREKELLSEYNRLMARLELDPQLTLTEEMFALIKISERARREQIQKIEALAQRQQAYLLFMNKKFNAALEAISPALTIFNEIGPLSDSQLCLLHKADCEFEIGEKQKALATYEWIPDSTDSRLVFAKAYLESKLFGKELNLESFATIPFHWMQRYEESQNSQATLTLQWHQSSGTLKIGSKILGKIKYDSQEGALLRLLAEGAKSKRVLQESLWPDFSEMGSLDLRFHELVKRLRGKVGKYLELQRGLYKIKAKMTLF